MYTLWTTVSDSTRLWPAIYIFIFSVIPEMDPQPLFYFYTNKLGIDAAEMTAYSAWQQGIGVLGIVFYGAFLSKYPVRTVMNICIIVLALLQCSHLLLLTGHTHGIPDWVLIAVNGAVSSIWLTVMYVPLYSLAALLCPEGLEALTFAFFTSASNFGNSVQAQWAATLMIYFGITSNQFEHIVALRVVTIGLKLLPLLCFWMLPEETALERLRQKSRLGSQTQVELSVIDAKN